MQHRHRQEWPRHPHRQEWPRHPHLLLPLGLLPTLAQISHDPFLLVGTDPQGTAVPDRKGKEETAAHEDTKPPGLSDTARGTETDEDGRKYSQTVGRRGKRGILAHQQ
jgi:hypothetical protein